MEQAAFSLAKFQVEYQTEPLDIETGHPRFSWQLRGNGQGLCQSAYRIQVSRSGKIGWDSGKVTSDQTNEVYYQGEPLRPCEEYQVQLTVWNQTGETAAASTWFETGMMEESVEAWEGAQWLGPAQCSLYAFTKEVFSVEGELRIPPGSERGGLVFGAQDPRLKDGDKNLSGLAGENYIAYELDVSVLPARLRIYRVGYSPDDRKEVPVAEHPVSGFTETNRHDFHTLRIDVVGHQAFAYLDGACMDWETGAQGERIPRQLNPLGRFDVLAFPMLCQVGFQAGAGSSVEFRRLTVRNLRTPKAVLFEATPEHPGPFGAVKGLGVEQGCFSLMGTEETTLATADPSHHSMPLLRTGFAVKEGLKKARLYVTARGVYQGQVNGADLSKDWLQPGANQFDKHLDYQIYDITQKLLPGKNAMAFGLASGWWSDAQTYVIANHNYFGDRPSLLAKLVLEYRDGSREVVATRPKSWRLSAQGPVIYAGNFQGEIYDARREDGFAGCSLAEYDDSGWETPAVLDALPIPLEDQEPGWPAPNHTQPKFTAWNRTPVRAVQVLKANAVIQPRPGVFVYDMGQNMAGRPESGCMEPGDKN